MSNRHILSDLPGSCHWVWMIKNFQSVPRCGNTWFQSPNWFCYLEMGWNLYLWLNRTDESPQAVLGVKVSNFQAKTSVSIAASMEYLGEILCTTDYVTVDVNKMEGKSKQFFRLPLEFDAALLVGRIKFSGDADVCISCYVINEKIEDPRTSCLSSIKSSLPLKCLADPNTFLSKKFADYYILVEPMESSKIRTTVGDRIIPHVFPFRKQWLMERSKFFSDRFWGQIQKRTEVDFTIDDVEEDEIENLLRFIFFGFLDNVTPKRVIQLYKLATRFQVPDLKSACINYVIKNITLDIVCDAIKISAAEEARTAHSRPIMESVSSFIARYACDSLSSDEWNAFEEQEPSLAMDVLKMAVWNNKHKFNM